MQLRGKLLTFTPKPGMPVLLETLEIYRKCGLAKEFSGNFFTKHSDPNI